MNGPKEMRMKSGISIEEAARKLGISGGYLSQIENGHRQISADRADQIAKLYGKRKEDIFLPTRYSICKVFRSEGTNLK
ncbi:transcriptional regulator [Bacillus thuringiensis]|uniref:helix-turn-helix domain-containing protein n=1 Tax=Bacillus thuringiensis TaxID=1428 RepID=UPI000BEE5D7C|nr:helix-turn-helix transcriptional regulator [Bacillus thuringiensis]MCU4932825.1 helix-turn-helix transcriptional regulator [Bacillus cereus]PEC96906.1 transcriptional regulator [Bacillus thuringiensis]